MSEMSKIDDQVCYIEFTVGMNYFEFCQQLLKLLLPSMEGHIEIFPQIGIVVTSNAPHIQERVHIPRDRARKGTQLCAVNAAAAQRKGQHNHADEVFIVDCWKFLQVCHHRKPDTAPRVS